MIAIGSLSGTYLITAHGSGPVPQFIWKRPPLNQCYCIIAYLMPKVYFENLNTLPTQAKCRTKKYIDYQGDIYTITSVLIWHNIRGILKHFEIWYLKSSCDNALRPRQNERHHADDVFKSIFLNWRFWSVIQMTLPPMARLRAIFQTIDWRRLGDKIFQPMILVYWRN